MESLLYIKPEKNSGQINMAIDQKLLEISERKGVSFFRFYHWEPVCISLGRGQNAEDILNIDYIQSKGFNFVSRITGGSYVLHKGDITYAIALSSNSRLFRRPYEDFYRAVHTAFYYAFINLGIDRDLLSLGSGTFSREHKKNPCFSHYSNHEVLIEGKKVMGSAQKRGRYSLLQHGSLLVENSLTDLYNVQTVFKDYSEIEGRITFLCKYLYGDYEEIYSAILDSVLDIFDMKLIVVDMEDVLGNSLYFNKNNI